MEDWSQQMEASTRVCGKGTRPMVKEGIQTQVEVFTRVTGKTVSRTVLGWRRGQTKLALRVIS